MLFALCYDVINENERRVIHQNTTFEKGYNDCIFHVQMLKYEGFHLQRTIMGYVWVCHNHISVIMVR